MERRIEGGERGLDRDLHLPGRGRRGSGGRIDRAMATPIVADERPRPMAGPGVDAVIRARRRS